MERNKIIYLVVGVVAVAALGVGLWFWSSESAGNKPSGNTNLSGTEMILFYSTSCPHCQKVEQYISDNKVNEKLNIKQLEVSGSQTNAQKFFEVAKGCGISQDNAGVPLLLNEGKCFQGDSEIVKLFKEKI